MSGSDSILPQSSVQPDGLPENSAVLAARLFLHMRNPQNLLNYMIFSLWAKVMGVTEYLPTITIG